MSTFNKAVGLGIVAIVVLLIIAFGLTHLSLQWQRYFSPMFQNVEREVFEETRSYSHGKVQDLAKYFEEYNLAGDDGKEAVTTVVKVRFAEFNVDKIHSYKLKQFLINIRGY